MVFLVSLVLLSCVVCCSSLQGSSQTLLPFPRENVLFFWPGDLSMTSHDRCSVAITSQHIVQVMQGAIQQQQSLPTFDAAVMLYHRATTVLWLGLAKSSSLPHDDDKQKKTKEKVEEDKKKKEEEKIFSSKYASVSWYVSTLPCSSPFQTSMDLPTPWIFPDTPSLQWDVGFAEKKNNSNFGGGGDGDGDEGGYLVADQIILRLSLDPSSGIPIIASNSTLQNPFPKFQRKIVGFGDAAAFPGTTHPTEALARQFVSQQKIFGEILLIDPNDSGNYVARYIDNLSSLAAHNGIGLALVDPQIIPGNGFLLAFSSAKKNNVLSLAFPFLDRDTTWTAAGVSFTATPNAGEICAFVVGPNSQQSMLRKKQKKKEEKQKQQQHDDDDGYVQVRFAALQQNGTQLVLLNLTVPIVGPYWLSQDPVFVSSPSSLSPKSDANYIYLVVRSAQGPVLVSVPFQAPKNNDYFGVAQKMEDGRIIQNHRAALDSNYVGGGAVLCNSSQPCQMLDPSGGCPQEGLCCQAYLNQKTSQFSTLCCQDCSIGVCVNNQCEQ